MLLPGKESFQTEGAAFSDMMIFPLRFSLLVLACAAVMATAVGIAPLHAQSVAVMVNGEPITQFDIDQRMRLMSMSGQKAPSRKAVMEELIDEKLKIREAKKYGVDPSSADIDSSYATMGQRMGLSADQLTQVLASRGIRPATLRNRIKAEMVWASLVRRRFKDSLTVNDRAVRAAGGDVDEKDSGSNYEYQMRPVILVVPRGSGNATLEMRRKEAETLRARVQSCAEASTLFRSMRNATIRDTVVKTSADLPQQLREILDKTPVGHLTPPEVTRQGIEMVALCERKPTTGDTPQQRQIREKLFAQKYEARSQAYLKDLRKAAMIEYR